MTPEQVFSFASTFAALGWFVLIVAGWYRQTANIIGRYLCPGLLSAVYLALITMHWAGHAGGFGSLADVTSLLSNPWILTAGWVHYLAFDLFVGSWEVQDAMRRNIPHWWTIPTQIMTFLFGPIGFLLYLVVRAGFAQVRHRAIVARTA